MASRRFRPMTAADVPSLPEPCQRCLDADWAESVTRQWGACGVLALHEDVVIGHLSLAPAGQAPRVGAFGTSPVSPDAAMVVSAHVVEAWRGKGVGRQLVQSAAGLAVRRDLRALEAVGTYADGRSCALPVAWLEAVGFSVVRPHPITPRLRMDLHSTLRWLDLGAAWSRLAGLVTAPTAAPEPASYARR